MLESKENVVKVFFFTGRRERGDEGYRKEENLQVNNRIVSQVRRTFFFLFQARTLLFKFQRFLFLPSFSLSFVRFYFNENHLPPSLLPRSIRS